MAKRRLPGICIDEHLPPDVKGQFVEEGFRVIRANESRYKSRDEREYLAEMYSLNEIFVTADEEFVDDVIDSGFRRHAGIVWLPTDLDDEQRTGFADLAAGLIKFHVREVGPFTMRGHILYPTAEGPTLFDGETNQLVISWTSLLSGPPV